MRMIILCFLVLLFGCTEKKNGFSVEKIPDPMQHNGYVSNPDHLISDDATARLDKLMADLDAKGTAQVAVVLLKTIGDKVPKDVAHEIFGAWKPGQKEKNNGLVVLLVDDQHRVEFETGYGLEGDLPDIICFRIQQAKMLPFFKQHDYDEGMWEGMNAVADVLNHTDSTDLGVTTEIKPSLPDYIPSRKLPDEGNAILYVVYLAFSRLFAGFVIGKKDKRLVKDPPILYNPGLFSGLWIYIFPALEILAVILFTNYSFQWWSVPLIMYLNWFGYLLYRTIIVNINAKRLLSEENRLQRYTGFKLAHKGLWFTAIIYPIPFYFYYVWNKKRLQNLRNAPYNCDACKNPMVVLSKNEKKKYLSEGQLAEEKIGSVSYDIWSCKTCDTKKILGYDNGSERVSQCPKCTNKTFLKTKRVTVKRPTSRTTGDGLQYYECRYCNYTEKKPFVIGKLSSSSASFGSSSSSSGSSSSSSWGGGSSGGGGAGSSW
jgi:uncharacterized protein